MGALVHRLEGRITARVAAAADRSLAEHRPVAVTESSRTESASPPAELSAWIGLIRLPARAKVRCNVGKPHCSQKPTASGSRAREPEWYSFGSEPRLPAFDQLGADRLAAHRLVNDELLKHSRAFVSRPVVDERPSRNPTAPPHRFEPRTPSSPGGAAPDE
jgi:hypothetical protein